MGPIGLTGAQGPMGPQGPQGPQGPPGPTGSVLMFAGAEAPSGWLLCDGSQVSRATYASLFATIGTTYGAGNGSTTFHLPNLANVSPMGVGAHPLGETGGSATAQIAESNLPPWSSPLVVSSSILVSTSTVGNTLVPSQSNNFFGGSPGGPSSAAIFSPSLSAPVAMGGLTSSVSGGPIQAAQAPFSVQSPYLALNFIIKN
ncbi:MAG: tail fiber protein [Minicystis sp.]